MPGGSRHAPKPRGAAAGGRSSQTAPRGAVPGGRSSQTPPRRVAKGAEEPRKPAATGSVDEDRIAAVIQPVVAAAGMDLESVRVTAAGRRRLLRVVVDSDGGVSLDDAAAVSRELSAALDTVAVMGDFPYTLEVSSPGVGWAPRGPRGGGGRGGPPPHGTGGARWDDWSRSRSRIQGAPGPCPAGFPLPTLTG
jgi:hypothetical protein